ncbi:MAG: hypothetical protein QOE33_998 [Acidobacteriota bacterium]|nr:hypothetical protein [Acidobacteriota bacterium]
MTDRLEQFRATLATYRSHGWQLARALMAPQTLAELHDAPQTKSTEHAAQHVASDDNDAQPTDASSQSAQSIFEGAPVKESDFDAMWFRRPSAGGREAWELRLPAEPYALFELFEADEPEEDREDVRRELEQKVRERLSGESRNDE